MYMSIREWTKGNKGGSPKESRKGHEDRYHRRKPDRESIVIKYICIQENVVENWGRNVK
jgi:hypothetical protein